MLLFGLRSLKANLETAQLNSWHFFKSHYTTGVILVFQGNSSFSLEMWIKDIVLQKSSKTWSKSAENKDQQAPTQHSCYFYYL